MLKKLCQVALATSKSINKTVNKLELNYDFFCVLTENSLPNASLFAVDYAFFSWFYLAKIMELRTKLSILISKKEDRLFENQ